MSKLEEVVERVRGNVQEMEGGRRVWTVRHEGTNNPMQLDGAPIGVQMIHAMVTTRETKPDRVDVVTIDGVVTEVLVTDITFTADTRLQQEDEMRKTVGWKKHVAHSKEEGKSPYRFWDERGLRVQRTREGGEDEDQEMQDGKEEELEVTRMPEWAVEYSPTARYNRRYQALIERMETKVAECRRAAGKEADRDEAGKRVHMAVLSMGVRRYLSLATIEASEALARTVGSRTERKTGRWIVQALADVSMWAVAGVHAVWHRR
jgi:hypothetical protein